MFVVAWSVDADAPLASAKDTAAIPNAGKALLRRLLSEERFDMAHFSPPFVRRLVQFETSIRSKRDDFLRQ
jgi:hypothetical protein